MITAKSSFDFKRVWPEYKNLLSRAKGNIAFYSVLGFFFFSLQYILSLFEYNKNLEQGYEHWNMMGPAEIFNGFSMVYFGAASIVLSIVIAVGMYSYMQNKRSVDVYHSLPLTRDELFISHAMAGLTILYLPMVINFLIVAAVSVMAPGGSPTAVIFEMICWLAMCFAIFSITALSSVCAGTAFDACIFSIGVNGALPAVYLVVLSLADIFLYGFASGDLYEFGYKLSPVSTILCRQGFEVEQAQLLFENNVCILIWVVAAALLFGLAMWVYRRRPSEQAETVGTMGPLQIFLRTAGTFVGGVLIALMFCAFFTNMESKPTMLISLAFSSVLVYFIGDVLLSRTVRSIPKSAPAAAITSAGVVIFTALLLYGGFGYENRVPKLQSVDKIVLDYYDCRYSDEPAYYGSSERNVILNSPEAIELILKAHSAQIEGHNAYGDDMPTVNNSGLRVKYELDNGADLSRRYYELSPEATEALAELEAVPELISQIHTIFKVLPDNITEVNAYNAVGDKQAKLTLTDDQKSRLLAALQNDLVAQNFEEIENGTQALGYVSVDFKYFYLEEDDDFTMVAAEFDGVEAKQVKPESFHSVTEVMITESFKNTLSLFNEMGMSQIFKNDFGAAVTPYIGIELYDISNSGEAVCQTNRDDNDYLTEIVLDKYYENGKYRYDHELARSDAPYVKISPEQFAALKSSMTSIYKKNGEPYAVVALTINPDEEIIGGHYFVALSDLPEEIKAPLIERACEWFGRESVERYGYIS